MEVMEVIEYPKCGAHGTENALVMQGRENLFLMLIQLECSRRRLDGKHATHALEVRYLSQSCENALDQAYVCVQGSDYILLTQAEARETLSAIAKGKTLFDLYNAY